MPKDNMFEKKKNYLKRSSEIVLIREQRTW